VLIVGHLSTLNNNVNFFDDGQNYFPTSITLMFLLVVLMFYMRMLDKLINPLITNSITDLA